MFRYTLIVESEEYNSQIGCKMKKSYLENLNYISNRKRIIEKFFVIIKIEIIKVREKTGIVCC